ncbi:adenine deaminase C-terminal domain-containing protein [Candidatus Halocynthiibacter alkanivorans]|uniref:adenine deaminase C-terminal domain-containing protein n=1 Tax=Candidatus Halocynthiibacter alkanivorans TaxID=2267619 RepID=UPI00190F530F|nr:adenine deaminase C-terminal domain-containing protein [Candidatus Halocynthiibacter alkanivorans]
MNLRELIRAGHGDIKADLVITNGNLINVASAEIYPAEVAIKGGYIVAIGDVDHCKGPDTQYHNAEGRYLAPGMIDGHLHVECSKLSVSSFADLVVPYGTTSIVSGLDQILVVSGLEGVRHFLDEANAGPMTIHWGAPCKTPYTMPRSTVNHYFSPDDHRETHEWPECIGIWETVREFIQEEDDDVIEALEIARKNKLPVFGCSPMCKGSKLAGYASAGIRLDHESYEVTEALEKLRNGMFILIRESSISHFLEENIQLATKLTPKASHRISFCTDDVVATDVLKRGHIDNMVRMAIREGVPPMEAIQMATINSAVACQIDQKVGLIAPGRQADILLVDSPETFNVKQVIAKGRFVAQDLKMLTPVERPVRPKFLTETMKVAPVLPEDLQVRADADAVKVLSMNMSLDVPFVRNRRDAVLRAANGVVLPDTEQDVLYVTVVERYGKTTNKPVAFVSGFGLKYGAMATSTAPDDNNIVCIGTNPEDMAAAVNWVIEKGGGQVFVRDGKPEVGLELPIGGIVSDIDPVEMAKKEDALDAAARDAGCQLEWPFMNMFVLSITAIPEYAITDIGAVDCIGLKTFDPILENV